ncbi:hypothetical protein PAXRUDRAFT_22693 [Paxillus rubicundulus Ve08.2h10]|uniref:Uncharacterized protein n=1 Tax=Paxillus rubicundulus Ve08.2h10 TaxID=930991 RepID=A0A0D0C8D0_9AGAM|nr:hypothetical protein PAXRUDRAFT_22693 [Paxillus rubicundulus Ve08.2h10]
MGSEQPLELRADLPGSKAEVQTPTFWDEASPLWTKSAFLPIHKPAPLPFHFSAPLLLSNASIPVP